MVAIIGGKPSRFRPLVDLYREAGKQAGYAAADLKVGVHCVGYVAPTSQEAADEFYPGYAAIIDSIGRERGWPPSSRAQFDAQLGPRGAFMVGSPEQVADKIARHSEALGGISRITLQTCNHDLAHEK
jgi:alkanesulfonate monooxygenase SsuD/methylene tetrahydromethanopterin reductase-like flavin-dependent oxidoreductase (luciferase family)